MASGSPRKRIDQINALKRLPDIVRIDVVGEEPFIQKFFTSRKKKPLSPHLKAGRADKDGISTQEGSPSAKATLDNYLVNSHDDRFLARCTALPAHGAVQRSLTLDINVPPGVTQKPFSPLPNLKSEEHLQNVEDTGEVRSGPSCEILALEDKHGLVAEDDNVENGISRKEAIAISSGGENLEHCQFAADFLSLYCGEVSCISSSSELKLKGHKRNGSPSLLIANSKTCKKKHYISDPDQSGPSTGHVCLPKDSRLCCSDKPGKTGFVHSGELEETSCRKDEEHGNMCSDASLGLGRCIKTPNLSSGKVEFSTPGSSRNIIRTCGASKSMSRSSNISPGDEFWDEAIQVADGLFAPFDGFVQVGKVFDVRNGQCKLVNPSSYVVIPQGTKDDKEFRLLESNASAELMDKQPKENANLPPVLHGEVSPLPVKRFDFLLEEKNLDEETPQPFPPVNLKSVVCGGCEYPESGSLNCEGKQTCGILTSCGKDQTNKKFTSDGKLRPSFPTSLSIHQDVSPSAGNDGPKKLQEVSSQLAAREGSGCSMSRKIDAEIIDNGIHGPRVLGSDEPNTSKNETKGGCVAFDKYDPARTPSSFMPLKDSLQLSNWLPSEICSIYTKRGISKLYPWQDCLELLNNLLRNNPSNKILLRETVELEPLISILKFRKGNAYNFTQQKTVNLLSALETIGLLLTGRDAEPGKDANKLANQTVLAQVECLQVDGVLQRKNLVYCASTSAGKSFVAEILMLRQVVSTGKMALLVLPYVSLCAEKAEHLEVLLDPLGKHVRSFYGNQGGRTLPKDTSVAVCTIEKANFLINKLLEEGRLAEVGIVVIDELHMKLKWGLAVGVRPINSTSR